MHAGFSFSHSPISLLLRQPLSIKKSYAGAIHLPYWSITLPEKSILYLRRRHCLLCLAVCFLGCILTYEEEMQTEVETKIAFSIFEKNVCRENFANIFVFENIFANIFQQLQYSRKMFVNL
jgi:hypothetical protein